MRLGLEYLKQGDRVKAKKKLLSALAQAPASADAQAAMAYYYEQTADTEQARTHYLKALDLSKHSGAQLNNYGTFLCGKGQYKESIEYFLKAVKDNTYLHTAGAYENAGLCALAIPDYQKAEDYFKAAITQDPGRKVSLYELVKLQNQQGKSAEALNQLEKHPDLVLNDGIFLELARDIANKAGKPELAALYKQTIRNMESKTDNS